MTRNTKLYKIVVNGKTIIFRTLTCNEITFLNNISNVAVRYEQAAKLAITEGYDPSIHFMAMHQIGEQALDFSSSMVNDDELFNLTVEEYRMKVKDDSTLNMILTIMDVIPSMTFEYLLNLTFNDLIEYTCLIERITKKRIFNDNSKKEQPQQKQAFFDDPDAGKSLAEKIKEDQKYFRENN